MKSFEVIVLLCYSKEREKSRRRTYKYEDLHNATATKLNTSAEELIMLSGIRSGKAKKKKKAKNIPPSQEDSSESTEQQHNISRDDNQNDSTTTRDYRRSDGNSTIKSKNNNDNNLSVAEKLKQALASGIPYQNNNASSKPPPASSTASNAQAKSYMKRVTDNATIAVDDKTNEVVILGPGSQFIGKREEDMTATELAAKERATGGENSMSWNEHMARDIMRVGKKRKIKSKTAAGEDSDEEVERMKRHMPDYNVNNDTISEAKSAKQIEKEQQRDRRRQIDRYEKQEKFTSMCSWWINSSSFTKHRLLAFGKHVSLMMAPPNLSLIPGHQFYLVPLKHATSIVDCDDHDVQEEIKHFRNSLENMYAKEGKGIVLCEMVLPNKGFWQTKVEVIPVPFSQLQDAPIYFKSAMVEQAEEFGTHNKLYRTMHQKPLRSVIPKKFPYFYIDWGNIATSNSTGYAQIIESSSFSSDFGLDTLAGMMDLDPIRFKRKSKFSNDLEKKLISEFTSKWKPFDWTQQIED